MSQKRWEARMNALALEAADSLRQLAGRRPDTESDSVQARIGRAARAAGFSYWRTFDLWYRKARRIDGTEMDAIRAARDAARATSEQQALEAHWHEYNVLKERIARVEAALELHASAVASGAGDEVRPSHHPRQQGA